MNPRRRQSPLLILVAAIVGAAVAGARAANVPDTAHAFMWDRANSRLAIAQSPADFADAAARYEDLIQAGVRNGPLFYNYGLALLEAQKPAEAMRALTRAERYAGTSPDIRQNLRRAEEADSESVSLTAPWLRTFLFWHYGLGLSIRAWLATVGISLICAALAARVWDRKAVAQPLHVLGVIVLIMFGTSAATSWHAEIRDSAAFALRHAPSAPANPASQDGGGHAPAPNP